MSSGTVPPGLRGALTRAVADADTARSMGSGDLDVLATPRLLAWCEAATVAALGERLGPGRTSVGTRVQLEHTRATPLGGSVEVTAELVHVDGRLLRFEVAAADAEGALVASGQVTRVVVDRDRFLTRLQRADRQDSGA